MRTRSLLCVKPVEKANAGTVSNIGITRKIDMNLIVLKKFSLHNLSFFFLYWVSARVGPSSCAMVSRRW